MKKEIFLVDADDTILDFHKASSLGIQNAFKNANVCWKEEYLTAFKKLNDELWEKLERKELTRQELIATRFQLYLKQLRMDIDPEEFNASYLKYLSENPIYVKGAKEFLITLGKIGRVFIITNGTERIQKSRFTISGLFELAEDTFISEPIGYNKPAKGYIEYVESHIKNYEREKTVWIGDSLSADIKGANKAGIDSIWFNPDNKPLRGEAVPTYIVNSFFEILGILQKEEEK